MQNYEKYLIYQYFFYNLRFFNKNNLACNKRKSVSLLLEINLKLMSETIVTPEIVEAMGISQPAFEEVQSIIGRMPTIDELSTLLAMWRSNGQQQSLYGWLKGQQHATSKNEYLYNNEDEQHRLIKEPKIKDCVTIAQQLYPLAQPLDALPPFEASSQIYMVGNVNTEFLNSQYAKEYLHLVEEPISMGSVGDDVEYYEMILGALMGNGTLKTMARVGEGVMFRAMMQSCQTNRLGFDILTYREVRLDAFLFGEEQGRLLVSLPEANEDFFLQKLDEARINCCYLGCTTKGRILVDGMDFGPISLYVTPSL